MDTPGDIGPAAVDQSGQDSEPPRRLRLEAVVESGDWSAVGDLDALLDGVSLAFSRDQEIATLLDRPAMACIALASDAQVQALNAQYRGKDKPTNVLSFPSPPMPSDASLEGEPTPLGDVVLAAETVAAETRELGVPLAHHVQHLVVHGVLHLLGYDHEDDEEEAVEMEALETRLLAGLGVADPYRSNE